jgi:hypothetical protein
MLVAGTADATYEGGRVDEHVRTLCGNNMKMTLDLCLASALIQAQ